MNPLPKLRTLLSLAASAGLFQAMIEPTTATAQEKTTEELLLSIPPRSKPPIVVLKLDDVSQKEGAILPAFRKMEVILEERKIKGSFGLICAVTWPGAQPLSESGQEYLDWVKKLHAGGLIEIWFHGWDHAGHTENGELYCEFNGRTQEEQKARIERAQKLAAEKLGFTFKTFGPGGSASKHPSMTDDTLRALSEDGSIRTVFYPKPLDDDARKANAEGKLVILDRVPGVGLEKKVGEPDFNACLKAYLKYPDRDYYVLQGHPNTWDDAKFAEVVKIIDFFISQKAVFMTPSELAETLRK